MIATKQQNQGTSLPWNLSPTTQKESNMSVSLYELSQQQQEILDYLYFLNLDEDSQERNFFNAKLNQIRGSAESKVEFLSTLLLESKQISEARREAEKRATKRKKVSENIESRLRDKILEVMQTFNIKKVEGQFANVSRYQMKKLCNMDNFDVTTLPDDLKIVIPQEILPIKIAILNRLKDGEEFEGLYLVETDCLRVG